MFFFLRVPLTILMLMAALPATAATIRVPADQPTIQAGIDTAVNGDTVLVSNGVYVGPGNRDLDFSGKAITLKSENGAAGCIIDCQGSVDEYHRCARFRDGEGWDTIIDGFTVRNGYMNHSGGAFYIEASPTIRNMVIENCRTETTGGGIFCYFSGPRFENIVVTGCESTNQGCGGLFLGPGARPGTIRDCTITGNRGLTGGGVRKDGEEPVTFTNCTISENEGYGILCGGGELTITDCEISRNQREGLSVWSEADVTIHDTVFAGNQASGVYLAGRNQPHTMIMTNCLIIGNTADGAGGGLYSGGKWTVFVSGSSIVGNMAVQSGGGVYSGGYQGNTWNMTNCILWNNSAARGSEIYLGTWYGGSSLTLEYSNLCGGEASVWIEEESAFHLGPGVIDADPLHVGGPGGSHYLSQFAAGQSADSPCVDTGDPASEPVEGTTRTDLNPDLGLVDMGYHYPITTGFIVTGPGPHPSNPTLVHLLPPLQDATPLLEFSAYSVSKYGVNVVCGDVTGTGADTILTGPGPGAVFGPHVRGWNADGTPLPGLSFLAYGTSKYGVNVSAGDVDGDLVDEILTGPGPGAVFGPHVRAFDYDGGPAVTPLDGVSFMAYGTLKWGVNVAAGDLDGDGYDEILTGAGPGAVFGPHVRGWNVDGDTAEAIPGISFFAYGTPRYGVVVGCGDVDGDGMDEIVTAPGPSPAFGSHIRGWNYDGGTLGELPGLSFFAWPAAEARYGATVWAETDLDMDGRCEIIVGSGPGPANGSTVKVFDYQDQQVTLDFTLDAFPPVYTHGVNVAAGRF